MVIYRDCECPCLSIPQLPLEPPKHLSSWRVTVGQGVAMCPSCVSHPPLLAFGEFKQTHRKPPTFHPYFLRKSDFVVLILLSLSGILKLLDQLPWDSSTEEFPLNGWQTPYLGLIYCFWWSWSGRQASLINQCVDPWGMRCALLGRCLCAAWLAVSASTWPSNRTMKGTGERNAFKLWDSLRPLETFVQEKTFQVNSPVSSTSTLLSACVASERCFPWTVCGLTSSHSNTWGSLN